jgi:hypothetical protein
MSQGARVTDEVEFYKRRGELQNSVRVLRIRRPERLRWRAAVASVTEVAGALRGRSRMRIEEPVREIVLDLDDRILRRESVLDARKAGVDLDRGEVLPRHSRWDLSRTAFLTGVDQDTLGRYMRLPDDYFKQVDTAAVVLVSRALANAHKQRADNLLARVQVDKGDGLLRHEQYMLDRADHDRDLAKRWAALSKAMVDGSL